MELTWSKESVILTQKNLIDNITKTHLPLEDHGRSGRNASLPLDDEFFKPQKKDEKGLEDPEKRKYQAIIGGLLCLNRMTRPEILIQVNLLGRRSSNPTESNMKGALATLRYLSRTLSEGIMLKKPQNRNLIAHVDASYGGEKSRS